MARTLFAVMPTRFETRSADFLKTGEKSSSATIGTRLPVLSPVVTSSMEYPPVF